MYTPLLSLLLVISTQILLCLAAGGRGKEPMGASSHYSELPVYSQEQFQDVPHHSTTRGQEEDHEPNDGIKFSAAQREVYGFAQRYLSQTGYLKKRRMSKPEWIEYQQNNVEEAQRIYDLYREKKRINKKLSDLRKRHNEDPNDPKIMEELHDMGYTLTDLIKGSRKEVYPDVDTNRIRSFLFRLRKEMANVNLEQGAQQRHQWFEVFDEPEEQAGLLKELVTFRDQFRKNPYAPELKPMLDHLHENLTAVYGRRYVPLVLPIIPTDYIPEQEVTNRARYGTSKRRIKTRRGGSSSDFPQARFQQSPPGSPTQHQQQTQHHEQVLNLFPTDSGHFEAQHDGSYHPHVDPNYLPANNDPSHYYQDPSLYYQDNMNPPYMYPHTGPAHYGTQIDVNYPNHQEIDHRYSQLHSQMDHMQLSPDESSPSHPRHLPNDVKKKMVRDLFWSEGESEEE